MVALSRLFDRLINGEMIEHDEKYVKLSDMKLETFVQVVGIAYADDYRWPHPDDWAAHDEIVNSTKKERNFGVQTSQENVSVFYENCWSRRHYVVSNEETTDDLDHLQDGKYDYEDFSGRDLLIHAKMYIIAYRYMMTDL
jgi:hypothetical protein